MQIYLALSDERQQKKLVIGKTISIHRRRIYFSRKLTFLFKAEVSVIFLVFFKCNSKLPSYKATCQVLPGYQISQTNGQWTFIGEAWITPPYYILQKHASFLVLVLALFWPCNNTPGMTSVCPVQLPESAYSGLKRNICWPGRAWDISWQRSLGSGISATYA